MGISYYTKFKSSSRHKTIFNCAMSYLVVLMMTSIEFLEDLENNQIKLYPKCSLIVLDWTMIEAWNKLTLELEYKKIWQDQYIANKTLEFEIHRVNIWPCRCYKWIEEEFKNKKNVR